jgi:hypothetical protein
MSRPPGRQLQPRSHGPAQPTGRTHNQAAATQPVQYADGINLEPVKVNGWDAWALCERWPNGAGARAIAFLDEEALRRIHQQATAALRDVDGEEAESTPRRPNRPLPVHDSKARCARRGSAASFSAAEAGSPCLPEPGPQASPVAWGPSFTCAPGPRPTEAWTVPWIADVDRRRPKWIALDRQGCPGRPRPALTGAWRWIAYGSPAAIWRWIQWHSTGLDGRNDPGPAWSDCAAPMDGIATSVLVGAMICVILSRHSTSRCPEQPIPQAVFKTVVEHVSSRVTCSVDNGRSPARRDPPGSRR